MTDIRAHVIISPVLALKYLYSLEPQIASFCFAVVLAYADVLAYAVCDVDDGVVDEFDEESFSCNSRSDCRHISSQFCMVYKYNVEFVKDSHMIRLC